MKIAAIVAEYNPFHNGHRYHIQQTREAGATHIVAILSGNFVQRGEPAILEKRYRTRAALLGGADLVIELPVAYAVATAERFAYGAVYLAQALGCCDFLSFGCESGNLSSLEALAAHLENPDFYGLVREQMAEGSSFAAARQQAAQAQLGQEAASLLEQPNNILALEYLRQLNRLGSGIEPLAISRMGAAHDGNQPDQGFASASWLREQWRQAPEEMAPYLPIEACALYREAVQEGLALPDLERYQLAVLTVLRRMDRTQFAQLPDCSEGLENRLFQAVCRKNTLEAICQSAKTKRYSMARIRRMVLAGFLGIPQGFCHQPPPYLRVLGCNRRGGEILAQARKSATLPVGTSLARLAKTNEPCKEYAQLEARATDLYTLLFQNPRPKGYDYTTPAVRME